ncbi:MAG: hypothetical protein ABI137_12090 [Antricoccus sp.]
MSAQSAVKPGVREGVDAGRQSAVHFDDRPRVPTVSGQTVRALIATPHTGTATTVTASGALSAVDTAQLAAMRNALSPVGGERAIVHLIDVGSVNAELLRVLCIAPTMLQGRLSVAENQLDPRFTLALLGLGEAGWPETCGSDAGADQAAGVPGYLQSERDWDC